MTDEKKQALYGWATFKSDPKMLEEAERLCRENAEEYSIINKILEALMSDCDGKPERLISLYSDNDENGKMIIDAFCVHLCGWSFPTLVDFMLSGEEVY